MALQEFLDALCDDLNTPKAISILNEQATKAHKTEDRKLASMVKASAKVLGFLNVSTEEWFRGGEDSVGIERLIEKRRLAKQNRDFAAADKIRAELLAQDVELEDATDGSTTWRNKRPVDMLSTTKKAKS